MKPAQNSEILLRQSVQFKKTISITSNTSNKSNDPSQQIADTFAKIHDTIDNLDSKVNLLLQKHEAEFLFAWRNHIKKIKKQLYDIKQRADEKQKQMNSNQRVMALEKQMSLFRDQSLRLYQQVQQRKSDLEILKRKSKEQQTQLQTLRQQNKQLIKTIKLTQAKHNLTLQRLNQLQNQLQQYKQSSSDGVQQLRLSAVNKISLYSNFTKDNFHKSQQRKTIGFQAVKEFQKSFQKGSITLDRVKKFTNKKQQLTPKDTGFHHIPPVIKGQQKLNRLSVTTAKENKRTQFSYGDDNNNITQSNFKQNHEFLQTITPNKNRHSFLVQPSNKKTQYQTSSFIMIQPKVYDSDLKNWFLDCIKAIKKQISSRKIGFSSTANDIMKVQSIQQFKTIDKLRLLEMFLQNEKLLNHMYQKIFPDRMKEIEAYLQNSNHINRDTRNVSQIDSNSKNNKSKLNKIPQIINDQKQMNNKNMQENNDEKIDEYLKNISVKNGKRNQNNNSKIRVKSVSKASKSQPIRNRIIMKDGKLGLMC